MHRSIPLVALAALALSGCTHLGTNVSGQFSCRAPKAGCQPLSEVDAAAIRQLLKRDEGNRGASLEQMRQRITLASADAARTGERTLRIVFPAHVDAAGTLHDEAAVWTVVEAARWAGELRRGEVIEPKGTMRALREALKDQAQRGADAAGKEPASENLGTLSPEDSAPAAANPFIPSSPLVLPSPGGEAQADVADPVQASSAAGGSDMSPTPHERAPRPLEEVRRVWPSAAAIEAARKLKAQAEAKAAPKKEPK